MCLVIQILRENVSVCRLATCISQTDMTPSNLSGVSFTCRACSSDSAAPLLLFFRSVIIFHTSEGLPAILESNDKKA